MQHCQTCRAGSLPQQGGWCLAPEASRSVLLCRLLVQEASPRAHTRTWRAPRGMLVPARGLEPCNGSSALEKSSQFTSPHPLKLFHLRKSMSKSFLASHLPECSCLASLFPLIPIPIPVSIYNTSLYLYRYLYIYNISIIHLCL